MEIYIFIKCKINSTKNKIEQMRVAKNCLK